jgi:hypothetical protein
MQKEKSYIKSTNSSYNYLLLAVLALFTLQSCKSYPSASEDTSQSKVKLDYSQLKYWAAHPDKSDPSDQVPESESYAIPDTDTDIFFIHPTTYTSYKGDVMWNADISNQDLNDRTDKTTIQYQASAFNSGGRVYAPRYRQAHIEAFYTTNRAEGKRALEYAYNNVREAFEYYLNHQNQGRNIIIASHSQGTTHAKVLLKEFFDGTELQNQLTAAYIIGIPVAKDEFAYIPTCQSSDDVGCYVSWRTFRTGNYPPYGSGGDTTSVVNPLSWKTSTELVSRDQNTGAVLRNFDKVYPQLVDAQISEGVLWVNKPKFPWSFLFTTKNYHIVDINLFYMDIRQNVVERIEAFKKTIKN